MTEDAAILAHLESGQPITPAMAYELYGCLALHSAAARLRRQGYDIACRIATGNGKRWGVYTLRERFAYG